jgi:hypothetical protein
VDYLKKIKLQWSRNQTKFPNNVPVMFNEVNYWQIKSKEIGEEARFGEKEKEISVQTGREISLGAG